MVAIFKYSTTGISQSLHVSKLFQSKYDNSTVIGGEKTVH